MHSVILISRFKNRGISVARIMTTRSNSSTNHKLAELLPNREQLKMELQMKSDLARTKFNDLFLFYERFTGLSEVRLAQQRVLDAQDQFLEVQEKRREVYKQLTDVQSKRKDIHDKLQITKPGEPRYLKLIMEDHEIIGDEVKLSNAFTEVEKLERELFTSLATAVRISHERERLQADKTKYWSIIGSIIGTIIGIIGSSINNSYRIKEIKCMLEEISKLTVDSTESSKSRLQSIESLLKKSYDVSNKTFELITTGVSQNVLKAWNSTKSQLSRNETSENKANESPRTSVLNKMTKEYKVKLAVEADEVSNNTLELFTSRISQNLLKAWNSGKSQLPGRENSENVSSEPIRASALNAMNKENKMKPTVEVEQVRPFYAGLGLLIISALFCSCCR